MAAIFSAILAEMRESLSSCVVSGRACKIVENMCVRSALQKIQHARLYRNVLFDAATGENAVQFWAELALAQQRKDHRVGEHRFHCLFAMHLAINTQQNL